MSQMRYRRVGKSGLVVSVVGLGGGNFGSVIDSETSRRVIHAALDLGVNVIDTSDIYGPSEKFLGRSLEGRRDDVVLATKFGANAHGIHGADWRARCGSRYIRRAVEWSLRQLRTDWIDLYQVHRPDGATPIEETLATLTDLVREGKVRYIGVSNFAAWRMADADWTSRVNSYARFVSTQDRYNLLEREAEQELVPAAEHYGLGVLAYAPLAGGMLTGKYRREEQPPPGSRFANRSDVGKDYLTETRFGVLDRLAAYADARGIELLDVAVGGLVAQPGVASAIVGATTPEQMTANVAAASWQPTAEDLTELDEITPTRRHASWRGWVRVSRPAVAEPGPSS